MFALFSNSSEDINKHVYVFSSGISLFSSLVRCPTRIVRCLAAHVGVFDLNSEKRPVCTHAEFIPLQALIEVQVSSERGIWYT